MRKYLLAGAAALVGLLAGALAWAQVTQLTTRSLSGNETFNLSVGGPQGPSFFTPVAQMRNGVNVLTSAQTSSTLSIPITVGNLISTAACGGAMTVNLPALPYDGQIFEWINGSGSPFTTGCVVAVTDGATIVNGAAVTTLAAGASAEWRYALATTSWYRIR